MMDSGPVRNMSSTLPNKSEKWCISLAFIIRIYRDTRSSECQIIIYAFEFEETLIVVALIPCCPERFLTHMKQSGAPHAFVLVSFLTVFIMLYSHLFLSHSYPILKTWPH